MWTELDALASAHDRQVAIVLTVFWHERSAGHVLERYSKTLGARVYAHEGGGIDRIECPVTDPFGEGDSLPGGIDWFEVERGNEVVLWLPRPRALVPGDLLLGRKSGLRLCPASWLDGEEELERARASLRRLLDLPLEMVLVSHGPPVLEDGRGALAEALDRNARAGD